MDVYKSFADGATKIQQLYTLEIEGYEFPVYITSDKDEIPSEETLKRGIETVVQRGRSYYDENRRELSAFFNENFARQAAVKYTRGDFESNILEDPQEFQQWFVRDCVYLMQQHGKRLEDRDRKISINDKDFEIKAYGRSDRKNRWFYWAVGDIIYDAIDTLYDAIQDFVEQKFPRPFGQMFLKGEYKLIAGIRRNFFKRKETELLFSFDDLSELKKKAKKQSLRRYRPAAAPALA